MYNTNIKTQHSEMNNNTDISYIEIENYEIQKDQICENFDQFLKLNHVKESKEVLLFLFDLDNMLFTQKNPYVKEPKFNQISEIGKIQIQLIQFLQKIHKNIYIIGITNKSLNSRDKETINKKIRLDLIISRGEANKSYGYNLQKQQINMVKKIKEKYNVNVSIAFLNNRVLEIECLNYFTFVPDLKVYRNNLKIIIPLIYIFMKGNQINKN